jgi:hypothetical protein
LVNLPELEFEERWLITLIQDWVLVVITIIGSTFLYGPDLPEYHEKLFFCLEFSVPRQSSSIRMDLFFLLGFSPSLQTPF